MDVRGKGLMIAIDFENTGKYDVEQTAKNVQAVADYAINAERLAP